MSVHRCPPGGGTFPPASPAASEVESIWKAILHGLTQHLGGSASPRGPGAGSVPGPEAGGGLGFAAIGLGQDVFERSSSPSTGGQSFGGFEPMGRLGPIDPRLAPIRDSLAARSPLYAQLLGRFPGPTRVADLPDPAGLDRVAIYDPNTNQIIIDADNLARGDRGQLEDALVEEAAHRMISQAALQLNPGSQVSTQENEVLAKTYVNLVRAEAQGLALTPAVMDQAMAAAFQEVSTLYGDVPRGRFGPMMDAFFAQVDIPGEPLLRQRLIQGFTARGFVA